MWFPHLPDGWQQTCIAVVDTTGCWVWVGNDPRLTWQTARQLIENAHGVGHGACKITPACVKPTHRDRTPRLIGSGGAA